MLNSSLCIPVLPSIVGRYKSYLICIRSILIKALKIQEKCIQIDSSVPTKIAHISTAINLILIFLNSKKLRIMLF